MWPEDHVCLLVLKGGVDHNSHGNVGAAIVRLQGKWLWGPLALEMLSAIISLCFFFPSSSLSIVRQIFFTFCLALA